MSNVTAKTCLAGSTLLAHGGEETVDNLFDFVVDFAKGSDDAMASTTTSNTKFWTNPYPFALELVSLTYNASGGGVTEDATNYATLQVKTDDGAGGTPAVALDLKTQPVANGGSGTITQNVSKSNTGSTPSACVLPVGGNLWYAITKSGSGVILRAGLVSIRVRKLG